MSSVWQTTSAPSRGIVTSTSLTRGTHIASKRPQARSTAETPRAPTAVAFAVYSILAASSTARTTSAIIDQVNSTHAALRIVSATTIAPSPSTRRPRANSTGSATAAPANTADPGRTPPSPNRDSPRASTRAPRTAVR